MKKTLSLLAFSLIQAATVSAFAQSTGTAGASTDPAASQSRSEVKAGASAANADKVNQFEDKPGAGVKGSGTSRSQVKSGASAANADKVNEFEDRPGGKTGARSRAEVKAERNAGASQLRANTEVPTPGTSSQPNLTNPKALTPEERAQRRAERKARRDAKRAERQAAGSGATMPANGGAGGGNPMSTTGAGSTR